jgi:ribosome-binding protein aMBF1 (putative translation factor)
MRNDDNYSIDNEMRLRQNLLEEKKFIRLVRAFIGFYNLSRKGLAKKLDINYHILSKVLNEKHNDVTKNQWAQAIEKLLEIDIMMMFDDMASGQIVNSELTQEVSKRIFEELNVLKRLRKNSIR